MMKVNISDGNSEISNILDNETQKHIFDFWDGSYIPTFQPDKLKFFKLTEANSDKYIYLKIRKIKKRTGEVEFMPHNIPYWCKNGDVNDFRKNDIENTILQSDGSVIYQDNVTTSEVFCLNKKDFAKLKNHLIIELNAKGVVYNTKNFKLNAMLYKDSQNNSSVFFFITNEEVVLLNQNSKIFLNKPNTSGVKVPKGGA